MNRLQSFRIPAFILVIAIWLLSGVDVRAQPTTVAYQGYLTDTDDLPVEGPVDIAFSLYDATGGGTALWTATRSEVPLSDGVFSVMLGSIEPLDGIPFDQPLYLALSINGGSEMAPRQPLGAAPSSLFAHEIADGIAVRSINGMVDDVTLEGGENVILQATDGTVTVSADAGVRSINGLKDDLRLEAGDNISIGAADGTFTIASDPGVRSINGMIDNVAIAAGENVTLTEADGTITIGAEGADEFSLPFEAVHEASNVAFKITSRSASAILAESESAAPAISANNSGTGNAVELASTNISSEAGAIEAFSFSRGYTAIFSHFGSEGSAGIFRATRPENNDPALIAGKQDLEINGDEFFNDAMILRGDAPILGIYGRFDQDMEPGLVLAGVQDNGSVVDKWGIVRQFFQGNGLRFTYGLNNDPSENTTVMSLTETAGGSSLNVPNGVISSATLRAATSLGDQQNPAVGGVYSDNVIYAWAHVESDGSVTGSYGCTVTKITGFGRYQVRFNRDLPEGAAAVVTAKTINDPIMATAVVTGSVADVAIKSFNPSIPAFVFADNGFYIQVVGRP